MDGMYGSYGNNYYSQPMNAQINADLQARYASLAQQYPQYASQLGQYLNPPYNGQNQQQMPNQQQGQQMQQPTFLRGRAIASIDEAKSVIIEPDGSVNFFPNLANKKIYTSQIDNNGNKILNTYVLDETPVEVEVPKQYAEKSEVDSLLKHIDGLEKEIENLKGSLNNESSSKSTTNESNANIANGKQKPKSNAISSTANE